MKKLFLTVLSLVLAVTITWAQESAPQQQSSPQQQAEAISEKLSDYLKLKPEQKDSVKSIITTQVQEAMNILKDAQATNEQKQENLNNLQENADTKILSILDQEQKENYKKLIESIKNGTPATSETPSQEAQPVSPANEQKESNPPVNPATPQPTPTDHNIE